MSANFLNDLRAFANGKINSVALEESTTSEGYDYEADEEFMQECMAIAVPNYLQYAIMSESFENLDEDVREAFIKVQDYMAGQGFISEATVNLNNPKINVVRMNKQAQIQRLKSIITLKMARKANDKSFTKYKLGCKIKKENRAKMDEKYGGKAERLAKKLYAQLQKNHKMSAVVSDKKEEIAKRK